MNYRHMSAKSVWVREERPWRSQERSAMDVSPMKPHRGFLIRVNIAGTRCESDGPGKDTGIYCTHSTKWIKTSPVPSYTLPPTIKFEQYLIQAPVIPKGLPSIGYSSSFNGVNTIPSLFNIYNLFHAKRETMADFLPPNAYFAPRGNGRIGTGEKK